MKTSFSGLCEWTVSLDGGKNYTLKIADPDYGNQVAWTIPDDIISYNVVFKVADYEKPQDYVITIGNRSISPEFLLISGPGLVQNQSIYIDFPITCVLKVDPAYIAKNGTNVNDYSVVLSTDPQFKNNATTTDTAIILVTFDSVKNTLSITWIVSNEFTGTNTYYQIRTTRLASTQLQVTSPNVVAVNQRGCGTSSLPDPTAFYICQLFMVSAYGSSGVFFAGENVSLVVDYVNTFPGSATFQYSTNNGQTYTEFSTIGSPAVKSGVVIYEAILPNIVSSTFTVRVVGAFIGKEKVGEGKGPSKQEGELAAAENALALKKF
jgi:hypothetical protein